MIEKAVDGDLRKFKENILFCWGTLAFPTDGQVHKYTHRVVKVFLIY